MIQQLIQRIEALEKRVAELESKSPRKKFVPPTYQDVADYIAEAARKKQNCVWTPKQIGEVSVEFVDFYISKGWMVGPNPMKDWRSAVRRWVRTNQKQIENKSENNERGNKLAEYSKQQLSAIFNGNH